MLTFYDDATGERTELSGLTLGNWAAKTANFFRDEFGLTAGDAILVDLPEHWQTAAILLGAWWAGASVTLPDDPAADPRVVVTSVTRLDDHPNADELVVAALDPFGMGVGGLPVGVTDYGPSVRIHGDSFAPGAGGTEALADRPTTTILDDARAAAAEAGIESGARVLSTRGWSDVDGVVANLLAPLVVGASLVVVAHPDDERLTARAEAERATLTLR